MYNAAEVAVAVALYRRLRGAAAEGALRGRVAVISPYREQREALRREFAARCGAGYAADVAIDTIDGFQARRRSMIALMIAPPPHDRFTSPQGRLPE